MVMRRMNAEEERQYFEAMDRSLLEQAVVDMASRTSDEVLYLVLQIMRKLNKENAQTEPTKITI